MSKKVYLQCVSLLFTVFAVVHLIRLVRGWEANIAGVSIHLWVSGVGVLIAAFLAYTGWKLAKSEK